MTMTTAYREGRIAKALESTTARIPSDAFLWAALASIGVSLAARLMNRKDISHFIGLWAPTILILGLYNKVVRLVGSERAEVRGRY